METLESRRLASAASLAAASATPPTGPTATYVPAVQGKIITVTPGQRITDAIAIANPGDHVIVKPGTYFESIAVSRSGTPASPIVLRAEIAGAVTIDATGLPAALVAGAGSSNVFVSGFTLANAANPDAGNHNAAVRTGDHWTIQDCTIQNNAGGGLGIFGDGVIVRRVIAQDNGRFGLGGSGCANLLVQDSITRRNNRTIGDPNGGGGKFTRLDGAVIQRLQSYENGGPGLWLDINNVRVTITGCDFTDNLNVTNPLTLVTVSGTGIDVEVSGMSVHTVGGVKTESGRQGPVILERSRIRRNANHGVLAYASRNVVIRNNEIGSDNIYLKDGGRSPYALTYLTVTGNTITNGWIEADAAVVTGFRTKSFTIDRNTFVNCPNLYRWNLTTYTSLASLRDALGFELRGSVGA